MNSSSKLLIGAGIGVTALIAALLVPLLIVSSLFNQSTLCTNDTTSSSGNVADVADIDPATYQPPEKSSNPVSEAAAEFVEKVALDDTHGYSQPRRNGNPDYDCSSLIYYALTKGAGLKLSVNYAFSTHIMKQVLTSSGFTHFTWSGNYRDASKVLQRGDIIVNAATHTEMYLGGGLFGGARHATPDGIDDGKPGDQGKGGNQEIGISHVISTNLTDVYRYTGNAQANPSTPNSVDSAVTAVATGCTTSGNTMGVSDIVPADLTHASAEDARAYARSLMEKYGWDTNPDENSGEFGCLVWMWNKESGWRWNATNPSSGAYGIPQSLPGNKMASINRDYTDNAATQIIWGLGYIKNRYQSPCGAKRFWQTHHWY